MNHSVTVTSHDPAAARAGRVRLSEHDLTDSDRDSDVRVTVKVRATVAVIAAAAAGPGGPAPGHGRSVAAQTSGVILRDTAGGPWLASES